MKYHQQVSKDNSCTFRVGPSASAGLQVTSGDLGGTRCACLRALQDQGTPKQGNIALQIWSQVSPSGDMGSSVRAASINTAHC